MGSAALATAATIIAPQAVISGAYSLSQQALHLGYLPRVEILHTSESERGQIYLPAVNWMLLAAIIGLVLGVLLIEPPGASDHHRNDDSDHCEPLPWVNTFIASGVKASTGCNRGHECELCIGLGVFFTDSSTAIADRHLSPTPAIGL